MAVVSFCKVQYPQGWLTPDFPVSPFNNPKEYIMAAKRRKKAKATKKKAAKKKK